MKKALLLFYFLAHILYVKAQVLYGLIPNGGNDGVGSLIQFIPGTNTLTHARSFENFGKYPYYTNLIQAANGKLYGMTLYGGDDRIGGPGYGGGVIFSFDPSTSAYTKLKNFDGVDGMAPNGSLMQASDGKLYGMTQAGGSKFGPGITYGVIFSLDPSTSTYTKLKEFDNTNGAWPNGSLMQASNGKLYGMTTQGGASNLGVIFSFDPSTSTYTKLIDFDGSNGTHPYGSLIQANDGKLYGLTNQGGSGNYGVIFSLDPSTSIYAKVKDFDGSNGANPYGNLMQAGDGKLYGMTALGGNNGAGVIFSFDPLYSTFAKLRDLDYADGNRPFGNFAEASDGKLYGITAYGGNNDVDGGVIFSFDPSSSTYTKLKDFDGTNGYNPNGSLLYANNGKLYGMTTGGGNSQLGVIFSYDPSSSSYVKVKDFDAPYGRNPSSSLVQANNGKLYGTTPVGGNSNVGVIFSYDPTSETYVNLKDFNYSDGAYPFGGLVQASNGKLYGMTNEGAVGINHEGVIFSFDPSTSIFTKLMDFDDTNGGHPTGSLIQTSNGKLYGMTTAGGSEGNGVLFSFDPSSLTYNKLKDFTLADGAQGYGSLMEASDGKLYGMTYFGGSNAAGVIFSFDPSTRIYTKLKDFDDTSNYGPYGGLMQASDGKIYGMTYSGGNSNGGILFSLDPSSSIFSKLIDFDFAKGSNPSGTLMQASDGKLYGMTDHGGSTDHGVIFSFDPSTSIYTKMKDLDGNNSSNPSLGSAFIEINGNVQATLISFIGKNKGNINQLSWKVENEQEVDFYELQRGIDGNNFARLSQIKAQGNSSYSYNDQVAGPVSSVYYYRLKIVAKDGNFKYSANIKLNVVPEIAIIPNLFSNSTTISFSLPQSQKVSIHVYDVTGRLLKKLADEQMQAGTHQITWYAKDRNGNAVGNGIYFLSIIAGNYSQTIKILAFQ